MMQVLGVDLSVILIPEHACGKIPHEITGDEAVYFIFDFPWDKDLIGEAPVQGENWSYTPKEIIPCAPSERT